MDSSGEGDLLVYKLWKLLLSKTFLSNYFCCLPVWPNIRHFVCADQKLRALFLFVSSFGERQIQCVNANFYRVSLLFPIYVHQSFDIHYKEDKWVTISYSASKSVVEYNISSPAKDERIGLWVWHQIQYFFPWIQR